MTALDAPFDTLPTWWATPIHDALLVERHVGASFRLCDTCGAILDQPCRTASGAKAKRNHKGRGA